MDMDFRNQLVDVLYGGQTEKCKCCGYCKKKGKYLTVKQMRKKECLGKQCKYLDKQENHTFWKQRNKRLQEKKQHRIDAYLNTPSFMKDMNNLISKFLGFDASGLLAEIR